MYKEDTLVYTDIEAFQGYSAPLDRSVPISRSGKSEHLLSSALIYARHHALSFLSLLLLIPL